MACFYALVFVQIKQSSFYEFMNSRGSGRCILLTLDRASLAIFVLLW